MKTRTLFFQKKVLFVSLNESSLKVMKNAFYFKLKALFVLGIFTFLPLIFGYVQKWPDKTAEVNFKIMTSQTGQKIITIHNIV